MPRFVVLEHDHPSLHWDFMLESGDALRTWRLGHLPRPGIATSCEQLPDHRRAYLDYEGPVSGNRGSVKRVLAGHYQILAESPARLTVRLESEQGKLLIELEPPAGLGHARISAGDLAGTEVGSDVSVKN